jgi:hypothetical protein
MFEINSDVLVSNLDARILHHLKVVDEIISNMLHIVSVLAFVTVRLRDTASRRWATGDGHIETRCGLISEGRLTKHSLTRQILSEDRRSQVVILLPIILECIILLLNYIS